MFPDYCKTGHNTRISHWLTRVDLCVIWHQHNNESVYDIDIHNMELTLVFEYGGFEFQTKVRRRMFIYIYLILAGLTSV